MTYPIKLNIGCADVGKDGYLNIDTRPTKVTHVVCDAWKIHMHFARSSVDEIYTRHMIEHLDPNDAREALESWHQVLKPNGLLHIICPDLMFHCQQFMGTATSTLPNQRAHAMAGFYGWRDESRGGSREDAHRWGYTGESLHALLASHGFVEIHRHLEGPDSELWHLNISARAQTGST